ncbi:carbohydrate ABC transporter permease [Chitinilyticum piscinae]|uniref:Carbohydrate ABC transporter permease n=1 Tax=Chitinilyticum piscinae TaxID=2866724 RepID=A0A8J7FLP1_9NEIS|nr:carbohydrate ABC transporter permease [Chitinilyticum piscinae]MBE9608564.1 carbohydrate ABC transporter permease [Chitinilyticum piscinae]
MKRRDWLPALGQYAALLPFVLVAAFPLLWTFSVAISEDPSHMWHFPQSLWPHEPGLMWFSRVQAEIPIGRYLFNSLGISLGITIFSTLLAIPCGYALSQIPFRGSNALFMLLLLTLMLPSELAIIPNFLTFSRLGLVDSYVAVVLPGLASAFGAFLMRQAFQDLPQDILDAARVDGASEWQLLWRVALPQCRAMVSALAIFSFVQSWNDYLWPAVILKDRLKVPLSVGIFNDLTGPFSTSTSMVMAAIIVAALPVLIAFACTQRYFLGGDESAAAQRSAIGDN